MEPNQTKTKTTPKDFFLYLGVMATLYASVVSLINLLFAYIDYTFPDILNYGFDPYLGTIRWGMAFLFIIFPAFLVGTWYINKDIRANPEKENIGVRKWLTYLALFVAGVSILIDLSVLIYTFLGGEITARFSLKVFVILLVSGFGLSYYLLDLRGSIRQSQKLEKIFGCFSALLVIASIVIGFLIVGSPSTQRDYRLDQQRMGDLQNIQWQIVNYWQQRQSFPKSLADLSDPISNYIVPRDPETGEQYEYKLGEGYAFQLCATLNRESRGGITTMESTKPVPARGEFGLENENWQHQAGKKCFERVIDPKRYPPFERPPLKI